MVAILNFQSFCKTQKCLFSKTVLYGANSTKFLTRLDRADCADFGCHNSIRLETKHFLNTLALTFISFSGRFVFAMEKHYLFFCERSSSSTSLLIIMSSPGQKRGTCWHVMAVFDNHRKCARCRDKGVGDDPCVKKQDCKICQAFTSAQLKQLSTPTYQFRKEFELKKSSSDSPASATPTLVDPADVSVLGRVHKESDGSSPASKKKRADPSPTPKASSKKKSNSKSRSVDLKELDEKCISFSGRFVFAMEKHYLFFCERSSSSTSLLIIMSSPGQKRGTCWHVMAVFDNHRKCARCRDKGVGDDPCVKKQDCKICQAFTSAQLKQLSTPTYQFRKEFELKKSSSDSPASATPTLVDPADVSVLGRVHKESDGSSPASKRKRADPSPTPKASSKKKSNSKSRSDDLKELDEKWCERFARLETMLVSKTFTVPVNPVQNPPSVVTSDQPFFDPGTSTTGLSSGVTVGGHRFQSWLDHR